MEKEEINSNTIPDETSNLKKLAHIYHLAKRQKQTLTIHEETIVHTG